MLGKLLKHEWKSTCKIMTVINLTVLLLTIAGFCILNMNIFGNKESTLLAVFLIIFYALSLAAFGIITEIYLFARFYRNLFTSEGYLMHTLPVTPLQLFHAKLIVGYFWYVINSLLIIGGVLLFSFVAAWQFMDSQEAESTHRMLSDLNSVIFGGNNDVISAFRNTFGCTPLQAAGMTVLFQLSGSLAALLMGYVSILLGQLMEKYRLASAIGFYIVLYIINQIISSFLFLLPGLQMSAADMERIMSGYFKGFFSTAVLSQTILSLVLYMVSVLLMKRKLNLE